MRKKVIESIVLFALCVFACGACTKTYNTENSYSDEVTAALAAVTTVVDESVQSNLLLNVSLTSDYAFPADVILNTIGSSGKKISEASASEQISWIAALYASTYLQKWSLSESGLIWEDLLGYSPDAEYDFGEDGRLLLFRFYNCTQSGAYGMDSVLLVSICGDRLFDMKFCASDLSAIGYVWCFPDYKLFLRTGGIEQMGIYSTYYAGFISLEKGMITMRPEKDQYFTAEYVADESGKGLEIIRIIDD